MRLPPQKIQLPESLWVRSVYFCKGLFSATTLLTPLLVVNVLQTLSLVVKPVSPRFFRAFNTACAGFWWRWCVIMAENVFGIRPRFKGLEFPDEENALVVANHQDMPDIVMLMCLAWRKKKLRHLKWFVKDAFKYAPGAGWGMLFLDCLFIKRNWSDDAEKIQRTFATIIENRIPLWLVSFPEGTRIKETKLRASQEHARTKNLWRPEHVLIPRTKGFAATVQGLRNYVDAVYDVTIVYPNGIPSLWQFLCGYVMSVDVVVRRDAIADLPKSEEGVSRWLMDRFEEKNRSFLSKRALSAKSEASL